MFSVTVFEKKFNPLLPLIELNSKEQEHFYEFLNHTDKLNRKKLLDCAVFQQEATPLSEELQQHLSKVIMSNEVKLNLWIKKSLSKINKFFLKESFYEDYSYLFEIDTSAELCEKLDLIVKSMSLEVFLNRDDYFFLDENHLIVETSMTSQQYGGLYWWKYYKEKIEGRVFFDTKKIVKNSSSIHEIIFTENGELFWQSSHFYQLKLSTTLLFEQKNVPVLSIKSDYYSVKLREFIHENKLFYYVRLKPKKNYVNSDVGIMTSSLSHELSNPLSSIKLATDLMMALQAGDDDFLSALKEINDSCTRSLDLVGLFLGFSKSNWTAKNASEDELLEMVQLSVRLLSTRLMSAGVTMDVKLERGKLDMPLMKELLIIFLYLLFAQLITVFEQFKMTAMGKISPLSLVLKCQGDTFTITEKSDQLRLGEEIHCTYLMDHLLDKLNLSFFMESNRMHLSFK
jgi:hypothetical protein